MKVKDLLNIYNSIHSAIDFIESNTDSDVSGIGDEMLENFRRDKAVLRAAIDKQYLTNALRKVRNKRKSHHN